MEKQADAWLRRNVNFHAASAGPPEATASGDLNAFQKTAYTTTSAAWRRWLRAFAIAHPEGGIAIAACVDRLRTERYGLRPSS